MSSLISRHTLMSVGPSRHRHDAVYIDPMFLPYHSNQQVFSPLPSQQRQYPIYPGKLGRMSPTNEGSLYLFSEQNRALPIPQHGFVPLSLHGERSMQYYRSFSPPSSPYCLPAASSAFMSVSPSPSLKSAGTATTIDSNNSSSDISTSARMSPLPNQNKSYRFNEESTAGQPALNHSASTTKRSPKKKPKNENKTDITARKQSIKTELCFHYLNGDDCRWGANCTYAHGKEELQMTTFKNVDVDTFRIKPCLTWIATGSCPYGIRCTAIHDKRIGGPELSWLPNTETQGNTIDTDINVDGLYQKFANELLYNNPFGARYSLKTDTWEDLYKVVNNIGIIKERRNYISEIHKLSIALKMRGGPGWTYKYCPQHVIYEELCMVLQECAFNLESTGKATPLPISKYNPRCKTHVLVKEIAFGPDEDPTVRGVALWFNIPEHEVSIYTPQRAKRFRYKKDTESPEKKMENKVSVFDTLECFEMVRPHDRQAFEFTTRILKHRFESVRTERLCSVRIRQENLKVLGKAKAMLEVDFNNQKRHWIEWAWPVNEGREVGDENELVPPVDITYTPHCKRTDEIQVVEGSAVSPIWDSMINNLSETCNKNESQKMTSGERLSVFKKLSEGEPICSNMTNGERLSVFKKLSEGQPICSNRRLPHILQNTKSNYLARKVSQAATVHKQSERCWKALLLADDHGLEGKNEWKIAFDHFINAPCQKVLKIVQQ